ncbi:tetraspanin-5 isoform X1 [Pteropus vampyrus]|uniref:Tetraspanin-5 isoform X1 n=1 Tax=Pteropus vampyrus TaxID=132908 RepID=A0A6P6CAS4_PTEVA|nr:tetraspanin-5 isoform X1 [Pteropus vampyrus]
MLRWPVWNKNKLVLNCFVISCLESLWRTEKCFCNSTTSLRQHLLISESGTQEEENPKCQKEKCPLSTHANGLLVPSCLKRHDKPYCAGSKVHEKQFLGITFLGIGLWAWNEKGVLSNISSITDLGGFDPVWLFLVVGGVMFILGFAGCIGALRENTFLLKFFSVFLGIIFFLELTAGVLAFVFKDWIKDQLYFFINNNIRAYRDDIDLQNLIDFTQEYWQCCGAFGADDWNLNIYFNCTDSNASRERCGVPFSCCTKDPAEDVINTQCGYDARQKPEVDQQIVIYTKGCVPQFEKWLQDNLTIVAGIFIGIALLQIFGICLAQNLVSDIEAVRASW